jgi:glucose/mannose-6-phosphate isomerase
MMNDTIFAFAKQFAYEPVIENSDALDTHSSFLLTGMGGSHLAGDLLLTIDPSFPLVIRRDYGMPDVSEDVMKKSLFIASSYSGNTEEVVIALEQATKKDLSRCVIAVGGKLIDMAIKHGIPYIQLPNTGIQPRSALGFSFLALLKMVEQRALIEETHALANVIDPSSLEQTGKALAQKTKDHVPVIYCSRRNETLAWNWKIKFNETGKVPAFYNVFPELNHNEMTGFDVQSSSKHLSDIFHVIMLKDTDDHPKILKRMDVVEKLYAQRGLPVTVLELEGGSHIEKLFRGLLIGDWTAVHTAQLYGLESEQVPMVEEFKKMIA